MKKFGRVSELFLKLNCRTGLENTLSIKLQLIMLNLIFIVIPLIVISLLSLQKYIGLMSSAAFGYSEHTIQQVNESIDNYIEGMVTLSMLPIYDKDLSDALKESNRTGAQEHPIDPNLDGRMKNFLFTLNYLKSETEAVYLYNNSRMIYYNIKSSWLAPRGLNQNYDFRASEWYRQARRAEGKSIIINTRYSEQRLRSQQENEVFSVAKMLKDVNTGDEIGAILIDINIENLKQICRAALSDPSENIIILDQAGDALLKIGDRNTCSRMRRYVREQKLMSGFYTVAFGEKKYLLSCHMGQYSGFQVVWSVPVDNLMRSIGEIKSFTCLMILVIVLFVILLILFLSRMVFRPIEALICEIKAVEQGNLEAEFRTGTHNEIGVLADSFNKMVQRLKKMIDEVYIAQLQKKDAQLQALQYQINPHFLYNTLESIHMTAELSGNEQLSQSILNLARLFRYAVEDAGEQASIRQELDNIRHYVRIMQMRMGNELSFFISCDEALYGYRLPKFTLQPLIENAVSHGFKDKKSGKKSIIVSISKQEDTIVLTIVDNGAGMDRQTRDRLDSLLEQRYDEHADAAGGIGVGNVHQRIRLMYGDQYGLRYTSAVNVGTQVVITIPANR